VSDRDQAKLIAERVARRVNERSGHRTSVADVGFDLEREDQRPKAKDQNPSRVNGAPVREELSAIRAGIHDLENKLDRIESKLIDAPDYSADRPRARVIDFLSPSPPTHASPSIGASPEPGASATLASKPRNFVPATQSPWLVPMSNMYDRPSHRSEEVSPQSPIRDPQSVSHPSQERFGVDEAAVSELVEFFENEKKCSVDPSGKPCDHCAMCSSRGF